MPEEPPWSGPKLQVRAASAEKPSKREAALALLAWLWDPKRRAFLALAAGAALFGLGVLTGSGLRKGAPEPVQAAAGGPFLSPPTASPTPRRQAAVSAASIGQAAPEALSRFSGSWVSGSEAADPGTPDQGAAPAQVERPAGPRHPEDARQPAGEPPAEGKLAPVPELGRDSRRATAPGGTGGWAPGEDPHAPKRQAASGQTAERAVPLGKIPGAGASREVQRLSPAQEAQLKAAKFSVKPASDQRLMTSDGGVNPITTDAGKSFAVYDGQGPHQPTGQPAPAQDGGGERVRVNLGGEGGTR